MNTTQRRQTIGAALAIVLVSALVGCTDSEPKQEPLVPLSANDDKGSEVTDAWIGRWVGPEGTYLDIRGGRGRYKLTIANLDGPKEYEGQAEGEGIAFQRDGTSEVVKATDGAGTGMKWLADKKNCLVIQPSEGFCQD